MGRACSFCATYVLSRYYGLWYAFVLCSNVCSLFGFISSPFFIAYFPCRAKIETARHRLPGIKSSHMLWIAWRCPKLISGIKLRTSGRAWEVLTQKVSFHLFLGKCIRPCQHSASHHTHTLYLDLFVTPIWYCGTAIEGWSAYRWAETIQRSLKPGISMSWLMSLMVVTVFHVYKLVISMMLYDRFRVSGVFFLLF